MVKRQYHSPRRDEQSRQTRNAVIEAAHGLFIAQGYDNASIRQIAKDARVSEQTVYRLFNDKPTLLREVVLSAVSGADQPVAASESDLMDHLARASTVDERLQLVARWIKEGYERGLAELEHVVFSANPTDPDINELAAFMKEQRYRDTSNLVRAVLGDLQGEIPFSIEDITDYIYGVESSPVYQLLVDERGWSAEKYVQWFVRLVHRLFLDLIQEN
jgi:AcrR family transcriptional regulator